MSDRLRIDGRVVKITYTFSRGAPSVEAIEQAKWISAMQSYYDSTYSWDGQYPQQFKPSVDVYAVINNGEVVNKKLVLRR